jgi:hypothetical protein
VKDTLSILDDFEYYIQQKGSTYDAWHVGITPDVKRSLVDHGVESSDPHIHVKANSPSVVNAVTKKGSN